MWNFTISYLQYHLCQEIIFIIPTVLNKHEASFRSKPPVNQVQKLQEIRVIITLNDFILIIIFI